MMMGEMATEEVTKGAFAHFAKNYSCDGGCGVPLKEGAEAWSCRTCDYDLCGMCYVG